MLACVQTLPRVLWVTWKWLTTGLSTWADDPRRGFPHCVLYNQLFPFPGGPVPPSPKRALKIPRFLTSAPGFPSESGNCCGHKGTRSQATLCFFKFVLNEEEQMSNVSKSHTVVDLADKPSTLRSFLFPHSQPATRNWLTLSGLQFGPVSQRQN